MSNFQEPKKQSEFATDIFVDFLMLNDYVGNMKMLSDIIVLSKSGKYVYMHLEVMETMKREYISKSKIK